MTVLALVRRFQNRMPRWTPDLVAFLIIVALGYAYLFPASHDVFVPNPSRMIGDGSDLTSISWQYRLIVRTFLHDPARLLFGAVFTEETNAPIGAALWIPWDERILVLLLSPFTRDETLPTVVTWALMSLSGLAMYVFGRVIKWPRLVAFGMGICFAYNNYTRARATVHTGFTGLFGIALVFTALELLSQRAPPAVDVEDARRRRRRTSMWGTIALFLAMTSAHYYIVMLLALSPFFLVYFVMRARSSGLPVWRSVGRLVACSLPAVVFLGWNFFMPVAAKYRTAASAAPEVRKENVEFLHAFGAHPIDYLGFDVKLGSKDWLKSRIEYTETIRAEVGGSNLHERSNGIRWSLLAIFFVATVSALWPGVRHTEARSVQLRKLLIFYAAMCFLLSLSPQGLKVYDTEIGPSLLIFKYLPNFRVPSRFGPYAEFGIIAVAGEFLVSLSRRWSGAAQLAKWVVNPLVPVIAIVDYAPINPMMMTDFTYARKELVLPNGECGMGTSVPFSHWGYWQYQQARGTGCRLLVPSESLPEHLMESRFSEHQNYDTAPVQASVVSFARCTGMDWVVFCGNVSRSAREAMCAELGWKLVSNDSCRALSVSTTKRKPMDCLP